MLTLAAYLRELILMKQQYGQEEDLYPLIYMLIHEKENMKNLSLRLMEKGNGEKELRELFYGYAAYPDMVVLSESFTKDHPKRDLMYGCVEVKASNKPYDGIVFNILNNKNVDKNNKLILNILKYNDEYINASSAGDFSEYTGNSKDWLGNITEFIGELLWYGKVLYTDGKVWKYIEICDGENYGEEEKSTLNRKVLYKNNNEKGVNWLSYFNDKKAIQIHVRCYEVGNLKDLFDIKSIDEIDKKVILHPDWQRDWARLKYNLAAINWTGENNKEQFFLKEDKNANQTDTP